MNDDKHGEHNEPWRYDEEKTAIVDKMGRDVRGMIGSADRLIVCVNACAGIDTKVLVERCHMLNQHMEAYAEVLKGWGR